MDTNALPRRIPFLNSLDSDTREIILKGSLSYGIQLFGFGLSYVFNVLLARFLGAGGTGIYSLTLSIVTVGATFAYLGLDVTVVRYVSAYIAQQEQGKIFALYWRCFLFIVFVSGVVTFFLIAGANRLSLIVFSNPHLTRPLQFMAPGIIPLCLIRLYIGLLKGVREIGIAAFAEGVLLTALLIAGTVSIRAAHGATGIAVVFVLALIATLLFCGISWHIKMPRGRPADLPYDFRPALRTALSMFAITLAVQIRIRIDVLMLGIWVPAAQVGIYAMASRTALLTGFLLVAMNGIILPKISAFYAADNRAGLIRLSRNTVRIMLLGLTPALLVLLVFPRQILSLFGPEFTTGSAALQLRAIGLFINSVTGPTGALLTMTSHERLAGNIVLFALVLNIAFNGILIPRYGMNGAALASLLSNTMLAIVSVYSVNKRLEIKLWRVF